jgi:hypothetical protein
MRKLGILSSVLYKRPQAGQPKPSGDWFCSSFPLHLGHASISSSDAGKDMVSPRKLTDTPKGGCCSDFGIVLAEKSIFRNKMSKLRL